MSYYRRTEEARATEENGRNRNIERNGNMEDKNIIRIENKEEGLARYEELLFRRDALEELDFKVKKYLEDMGEPVNDPLMIPRVNG